MAEKLETERILRVDHAGELGAINIYRTQIAISKMLWPELVSSLQMMLSHEEKHFGIFDEELKRRGVRTCYALTFWVLGGKILGFITALLGPKSIFACTAAVEDTVYRHIQQQLSYLRVHDQQAFKAVESIAKDEKEHLEFALERGGEKVGFNFLIWLIVSASTSAAIWLSKRM